MTRKSEHARQVVQKCDHWYFQMEHHNHWVTIGPVRVYFRKGPHPFQGQILHGLTLANAVVKPQFEGSGFFAPVLKWMESKLEEGVAPLVSEVRRIPGPLGLLYVENVSSRRLQEVLARHSWEKVPQTSLVEDMPSFYKLRKELYSIF